MNGNTASVSVPNPTRNGYDFAGWSYTDKNNEAKTINAGSGSTTVAIKGNIDKTTIFGALWKRANPTVTFDLNGGSWSNANTASVKYGEKASKPTVTPTKNAYAFSGWVVKGNSRAMKGSQEYIDKYGPKAHFSVCSRVDDYHIEGHTFDKNGKCACGAEKPVPTVC